MMVALAVWICAMALVSLAVVPLIGWKSLLVIGPVLLALSLAACWFLCVPYERARVQWDSAVREAARRRDVREELVVQAAARARRPDRGPTGSPRVIKLRHRMSGARK